MLRYQSIIAAVDASCSATVVAGQLGRDAVGQLLAELDAPLVEAVDAPHHALDEHDVLVEGDQLTEHRRRELGRQDRRRRPVAGERAPRLVGAVATERQRLGLGDQVGDEQVVVVAVAGGAGWRSR